MNLLVAHLIGDFILQNDMLAAGKKRSSLICLVHCLLYTLAIWGFTGWPLGILLLVCLSHFLIDRWAFVPWIMEQSGQGDRFAKPPLAPWSIILVDNTLHLLVLLAVQDALTGKFLWMR